MRKILTFGIFDAIHPMPYLIEAHNVGDELYMCVLRDEDIEKTQGHLPKKDEKKRKRDIAIYFPDAFILLGDETEYIHIVEKIKPDVIVIERDQKNIIIQLKKYIKEKKLDISVKQIKI